MNYCCAKGNCAGCWQHYVRHNRMRYPTVPPRTEPYPIVNQDTGDEDDGAVFDKVTYHRGHDGVWRKR